MVADFPARVLGHNYHQFLPQLDSPTNIKEDQSTAVINMAVSRKKKHMDEFLREVFKQYIAIKDADYKKSQAVFTSVFDQVKQKMSERDNFYGKYSSQVMNAGSVYDGIKVGKLDEFDMDIVIRLPINYEDGENGIVIENHKPGFVKMKITNAFDNLDKQPDWEKCHVVTRDWRDTDKYVLQNKFRHWMHSIVQKAVNDLNRKVTVHNVDYLLDYKESGPAYTLNIRNVEDGEPFSLDVDLVPVIKMTLPRWPEGYRSVDDSQVKDWLVVPKPLKSLNDKTLRNRCWRLAFHDFERELLKGCELLKFTIRLLKKLRDSFDMKDIASYYIKTLFLWEINERQDKKYWQNKVTVLFADMVQKLYEALKEKRIRYYWHEDHNLIEGLKPTVQKVYCDKLGAFLVRLRGNDVDSVVACLLLPDELAEFKNTEFYKSFPATTPAVVDTSLSFTLQRQDSVSSVMSTSSVDGPKQKTDDSTNELLKEILASNKRLESKFESLIRRLENKFESLSETVDNLSKSIVGIEMKKTCDNGAIGDLDTVRLDINDKLKELQIGAKSLRNDAGDVAIKGADLGEMVFNVISNLGDLAAAATIPETETGLLIEM